MESTTIKRQIPATTLSSGQLGSRSTLIPRFTNLLRWTLCTLLLLCAASSALAQLTSADILGTVTDSTGAVVPNAQVVLINQGTHDTRTATSNGTGDYQFSLLPVGVYSVTVKVPGFKTSTSTNLSVEAGDRARSDFKLVNGGLSDTVTVEAQTPLLQADSATVSSTVTAQAVQDLPLNGRNFVQLVQLVPGANEGPGNGLTSGGRPDDRRSSSGIAVNGQDNTLNNFVIDGIDDNERVIGTIAVKPNVEGIQEISIQTNSYAAEAGRTAGGVINIVTRSGTNTFHGSLYEYIRNDALDARNVLQNTGRKPELRQNQYGGSLGGPILKDKLFVFGDYEGFRQVSGTTYTSTVPTLAAYNDIHSIGAGNSPAALIAMGNTGTVMAIDPVALNILKLFPAPTNSNVGSNYITSPSKVQNSNLFDVRADYNLNSKNLFFARYNWNKVNTVTPSALGMNGGLDISGGRYIFAGPATDKGMQGELSYTHIFSERLVLDLKAGYTRVNNLSLPLNYGANADTTVGFGPNMNFNTLSNFLTPIGIGSFSDIGDGAYVPLQDIDNTFQYTGTVSYTIKNHNIKAGASFIRRQARNVQSAFAAGQYGFGLATDSCAPGTGFNTPPPGTSQTCITAATPLQTQINNLASTLVGAYSSASRNYDLNPPDYRTYEPSGFIQDSWKATSKLTVLLGVRYDVFTPFTEAHNHISNFDFNSALNLTQANIGNALQVANVNGVDGHAGIKTDYSNVAPRAGFAYSVTPKIVVRGGYGLSYFPGNYTSNADLKNAPFVSVYSPGCQSTLAYNIQHNQRNVQSTNADCATVAGSQPYATFDAGLPVPAAQTLSSTGLSFVAENPNFKSARIQQYNLQVEQQFGANVLTIGYVGNLGSHLPEEINDINVPTPAQVFAGLNATTPTTAPRPLSAKLPSLGTVNWLQSEGISNYNGLQTSFQRRLAKGLAFDANYTWSKALSDITGFSEEGQQGWSNADPTRIRQIEYGAAENDIRNRFALSLNYAIPFAHGFTGLKKAALDGWEINTITVWQSGKPFSVVNNSAAGGYGNRASPIYNGGNDRPNQVGSPNSIPTGAHKGVGSAANAFWFNPAAFAPQTLGTVGTTSRNSLYGPRFRHIDMSLFKDFHVKGPVVVQFRAEAFDITNTPNYYINNNAGEGGTQLGNANFGKAVDYDPNYTPREVQFALKVNF